MGILSFDNPQLWIMLFQVILTGIVVPTLYHIHSIKNNHLHSIEDRLDRIEEKLDRHISWHINRHER